MKPSTHDTTKPQPRRPTETGTPVMVRVQADMLEQLDAWCATQRPIPSRPEAIRQILKAYFEELKEKQG